MPAPFVPFGLSASPATAKAGSRPGGPEGAEFKALMPASPRPPAAPVPQDRPPLSPAAPEPGPSAAPVRCGSAAAPKVSVERDGDRVKRIRIECACGELIELACEY